MATNPMQRKARLSFFLGVVVTLVVTGIVIGLLFYQLSEMQKKEKENQKAMVQVYTLNQDVKSGQVITTDMYTLKTINKNMVPSNATSDLSIIDNYALQDKSGNEIYTKYDKNSVATLYIKIDDKDYELEEEETGNYYYVENDEKKYVELNSVPLIAKVDMNANTIITTDLLSKGDNTVADDVRRQEYNVFVLPMDLATGDYIDVRLMLPSGQDYIVIAKKEVEIPNISGTDSEDTVWLNLSEDEILSVSSAIVDAFRITGSKLYVTKYTEAGMQEAATPTYVASSETVELLKSDPNVLSNAMTELTNRYNKIGYQNIRSNYINKAIESVDETERETNLQTKMEESITNTQDSRKQYLDSLSGAVE